MSRRSDPADNDMLLYALLMIMINIGIAPTIRTEQLKILRMRIDDYVLVHVDASTGQLAGLFLRAGEIEELVVSSDEGCQMRKDGNFCVAVAMVGNGRAIDEDDIAVVDAQVLI